MSFPPGTEMFQFSGFASPKPILFSLVIPFPFNSETDCSASKLNGEGGLSHSEIVGSKLAHSSPTLIAACHVLHRLYMPRHSPDALTSRLRVHTTNDNTGHRNCLLRHSASAAKAIDVDNYAQPDNKLLSCNNIDRIDPKIEPGSDTATASIKKTHSQCQREDSLPIKAPHITARGLQTAFFIPGVTRAILDRIPYRTQENGGAYRDRTDDLMLAKQPLSQLS